MQIGLEILRDNDALTFDSLAKRLRRESSIWCQSRDFLWSPFHYYGQWSKNENMSRLVSFFQFNYINSDRNNQNHLNVTKYNKGKLSRNVIPWLLFRNRHILVIGRSDTHLEIQDQMALRQFGVQYIFSMNIDPITDFSVAIPLGLTNQTSESKKHLLFGNQSHFEAAYSIAPTRPGFNGSIYANFSIETAIEHRLPLHIFAKSLSSVVSDEPSFTSAGRVKYLAQLRTCNFVLAPRGNGLDTHRLWETLLMGGIPIVLRDPGLNSLLSNLPVVQVDDWAEIADKHMLKEEWNRIMEHNWSYDFLRTSYWVNQIKEKAIGKTQ